MNDSYDWLLLGHFIGIAVLVGANGLDIFTKLGLLRATTIAEQRALLRFGADVPKLTTPATVLLFGCGVGLILDSHSTLTFGLAWVVLGIVIVVAMSLIEPFLTGRRLKRLETALADSDLADGPAGPRLIALARDPVMHTAHRFGITSTVELFYVMTLKPGRNGALVSVVLLLAATAAVSAPLWRRQTSQARPAATRAGEAASGDGGRA